MRRVMDYQEARALLLERISPVGTETIPLETAVGRILAADLWAKEAVPSFDRSAYDGYAIRWEDSRMASEECPVTLRILEEVKAGDVPSQRVTAGTAVKILTGAPIPPGADTVVPYEKTRFDQRQVTLDRMFSAGRNIIRSGEDVQAGTFLAACGVHLDPGLMGAMAAQGIERPLVYARPLVGLISTGNELADPGSPLLPGKTRNTNRYMLTAALEQLGCRVQYLGMAEDKKEEIGVRIQAGLESCDAVLLTGGVSVGDYDLTPAAMRLCGVEVLVHRVNLKPGMACAYGFQNGKLVCGLSGNPAAAMTNFYTIVLPAIRKLCGSRNVLPERIPVKLLDEFPKKSPQVRILRGKLELSQGIVGMRLSGAQGNVVIHSGIGCQVMAEVPAESGPLPSGTVLEGWLI